MALKVFFPPAEQGVFFLARGFNGLKGFRIGNSPSFRDESTIAILVKGC